MKKILIGISGAVLSANVALAQVSFTIGTANTQVGGSLHSLIAVVQGLVNQLSYLAYGVATLAFFWFLIQVIIAQSNGDEDKKKNALKGMGWSILAIALMYAILGVISFLSATTGIATGGSLPTPAIPTGAAQ